VIVLSWTFVASQGTSVHVANLTRSSPSVVIALCGKPFDRPVTPANDRQATCDKCRSKDDPFHTGQVPFDPNTWVDVLTSRRAGQPKARSALLTRDLVTVDGVITPRGALLSRDLTSPTPWVDNLGITHARLPAGRRLRGACGADLLGIGHLKGGSVVNYDRLGKARATYEDAMVDCMTCATILARAA
jgi:hypothetical protein